MALLQEYIDEITKSLEKTEQISKFENPKVSIVVPAFNSEKYISKCLFSLINQTLKEIEIIVVNDGSDDDTEKVIKIFAEYDKRIVYLNQKHQLQGAARNNGINNVKGEYVGFVDSDDWIDRDYYEKLYTAAQKFGSDIALATNVRIGNGKTKKRLDIRKEEFLKDLQARIDACHQWKDGCPTNKIYKVAFLKKYNILFPEGVYCEDKIFTIKAIYYSNGIVTVPDVYYYYYRNPDSTVMREKKHHHFENAKNRAKLEVLNFLKENNVQIRDKDFWAITSQKCFCGIPFYTKKESLHTARHYVLSIIKVKENKI